MSAVSHHSDSIGPRAMQRIEPGLTEGTFMQEPAVKEYEMPLAQRAGHDFKTPAIATGLVQKDGHALAGKRKKLSQIKRETFAFYRQSSLHVIELAICQSERDMRL